MEKTDDADDLFAGLDPPRPKTNPSTSAASRNDFMSSLFGGGSKTNTASATSNPTKSRDFVLEEKYTAKERDKLLFQTRYLGVKLCYL